jgi:hypothetical protein
VVEVSFERGSMKLLSPVVNGCLSKVVPIVGAFSENLSDQTEMAF